MPETHKSGLRFNTSLTAIFTQSTGVPLQLYSCSISLSICTRSNLSVLLMVMA